jgi:Transcription-repair coupling factor (superfamily II helicase)
LKNVEVIIKNLKDLRSGSLIVYRDYGMGIYEGLNKMEVDGIDFEFIRIIYGNDDMVQLLVTEVDKICRYIGDASDEKVFLKLGIY